MAEPTHDKDGKASIVIELRRSRRGAMPSEQKPHGEEHKSAHLKAQLVKEAHCAQHGTDDMRATLISERRIAPLRRSANQEQAKRATCNVVGVNVKSNVISVAIKAARTRRNRIPQSTNRRCPERKRGNVERDRSHLRAAGPGDRRRETRRGRRDQSRELIAAAFKSAGPVALKSTAQASDRSGAQVRSTGGVRAHHLTMTSTPAKSTSSRASQSRTADGTQVPGAPARQRKRARLRELKKR